MKKTYIVILCLLYTSSITAQTTSISGSVKDIKNSEVLTGASIVEKGTTNGTTADSNGQYTLQVSEGATLVFSFVGYTTQEQKINGRSEINISLAADEALLGEVMVTALNLNRSSRSLGYTVQQLDSKEVSEVKSPNFVDNLAGRVAGISVTQGATGVGSTSKITIRGEASFTNNNPLFVVDGVLINNSTNLNFTNAAAAGFQEVDFGNGGMEISQDDIASVNVLKGPSAAALYGTRAANGVVIVTTKDGSKTKGLGISFNSTTFIDRPFQLPEFQNQYGQGNSGQFEFVDGLGAGINDNITYSWGPALNQGLLIPQFDSPVTLPDGRVVRGGDVAVHGGAEITPTAFNSHPDNLKNFYETGTTKINNIALSSASEKGNYRLSFTDLRSDSYIPGVNLDRKTAAGRFTFTANQQLKISTSFNYINSQSDNRPANGYGSENTNYSLVAWGPRSLNIESLKDYWQPNLENVQQFSFNYTFFDNPYFILLENKNSFNRDRLFGSIAASYQFTEELSLNLASGMDYSNELRKYIRHFSTNRFKQGAYAEQSVFFREINSNFLLNYQKDLGNFKADISLGGNRMDQTASSNQTEALSLAQPGIFNFSNAASPLNVFQFEAQKRINSLYGLAKFAFKDFLYLDITGRNDWSSALATRTSIANTSFFYPSISASYVLSNTMNLPNVLSFAKLRASWAQVGNDTAPYQTGSAFVAGTTYNSQPTFTTQDVIANANLQPEQTTAIEVGADLRFLDDRLRFDFTYYNALTENQIISFPVPISSGYNEQVVNGGAVRSKGVEILAGLSLVREADFKWDAFFNFSQNVSTVESLPEGAEKITLAFSSVYDNVNQTVWFQVEEGGKIGDMYGTGYQRNENGDFIIDANGRYIADNSLQKLGNYNPDFSLGFSNNLSYKNWDLGFLLDWRQGGILVSRTLSLAAVGGQLIGTADRPEAGIVAGGVVNVGEGDNVVWSPNTTAVSAETYYRQFYDRNHEENNTYDASYLKLRQLSIGYHFNLPQNRTLNIALIGRNLYAWSEIPHFDPEQLAVQGNQFVNGVEDMSYPSSRSLGIKLGLEF
ncbi:MAG: SusC/RagA family TonB-linked outer membrane protein [Chitinophagales bacterium]